MTPKTTSLEITKLDIVSLTLKSMLVGFITITLKFIQVIKSNLSKTTMSIRNRVYNH